MSTQDPLEAAILNGSLFRGPRTPSPTRSASTGSPASSRSPSPSPSGSSSGSRPASPRHTSVHFRPSRSRSDRPGAGGAGATARPARTTGPQTGVKGVRADRAHANAVARESRARAVEEANERLGRMGLVGRLTADEEAALREGERARVEREALAREGDRRRVEEEDGEGDDEATRRWREARIREMRAARQPQQQVGLLGEGAQRPPTAHFGHLREVDERGYVKAVEDAGDATAVVVHIYSKLVPACQRLTSSLSSLARLYPSTRFLQVRALSIGFGRSSVSSTAQGSATAFGDVDSDEDEDDLTQAEYALREREAEEKITDVLPTLLVYKEGELVGNLVRVDLVEGELWRGGAEEGVLAVLKKYGAVCDDSSSSLGGYSNSIRDRLGLYGGGHDGEDDDEEFDL